MTTSVRNNGYLYAVKKAELYLLDENGEEKAWELFSDHSKESFDPILWAKEFLTDVLGLPMPEILKVESYGQTLTEVFLSDGWSVTVEEKN